MRKSSILIAVFAVVLAAAPRPAAAVTIGFVPAAQTIGLSGVALVDVVVSGLEAGESDEIVAAFDLDVGYDPLVLAATSVTFGAALGALGLEALADADLSAPGLVDFAALSLLSDADLAALQGDTVTLATLHFSALALGTSALTLVPDARLGIDVKGRANAILPFEAVDDGAIHVVPEPSVLVLLAAGLVGLSRVRVRGRRSCGRP